MNRLTEAMQFIGNYTHYRKIGYSPRMSWHLAGLTLPS